MKRSELKQIIREVIEESKIIQEAVFKVSDEDALSILNKLVKSKLITNSIARFLNVSSDGGVSFGPQSGAQTNVGYWNYWPKGNQYYYKEYELGDEGRKEFIQQANAKINNIKKTMKTAIKYAESLDDLEAIAEQLEEGASVAKRNSNLRNDSTTTWRMLEGSTTGKNIDHLFEKNWKKKVNEESKQKQSPVKFVVKPVGDGTTFEGKNIYSASAYKGVTIDKGSVKSFDKAIESRDNMNKQRTALDKRNGYKYIVLGLDKNNVVIEAPAKTPKETVEESLQNEKITYYNVNIGLPRQQVRLIDAVEDFIAGEGWNWNNDGSDFDTYNINVGVGNRKQKESLANKLEMVFPGIYVETEEIEL